MYVRSCGVCVLCVAILAFLDETPVYTCRYMCADTSGGSGRRKKRHRVMIDLDGFEDAPSPPRGRHSRSFVRSFAIVIFIIG